MLVGIAAAVAAARFVYGLGATTRLSDATPWGLWIGFDVMGGVALAAGGFIMTLGVHLRLDHLHPIVRPAGSLPFSAIWLSRWTALRFGPALEHLAHDRILESASPLFEVGWCVMLYLAVLTRNFSLCRPKTFARWQERAGFL